MSVAVLAPNLTGRGRGAAKVWHRRPGVPRPIRPADRAAVLPWPRAADLPAIPPGGGERRSARVGVQCRGTGRRGVDAGARCLSAALGRGAVPPLGSRRSRSTGARGDGPLQPGLRGGRLEPGVFAMHRRRPGRARMSHHLRERRRLFRELRGRVLRLLQLPVRLPLLQGGIAWEREERSRGTALIDCVGCHRPFLMGR